MKAIEVDGDDLVSRDVESQGVGPGEVRIKIAATAINRADLVQRSGGYPPPPGASHIMGLECAGTVTELGEGVKRVAVGDEVCALLAGGGYAEEAVVPAGQVLKVPAGLSMAEAAAIPEVFATAYLNLYMEAALKKGERVVVHAGASGVGTAAIQMLKASGKRGVAQGGVISPLLSNFFLAEVDKMLERMKPAINRWLRRHEPVLGFVTARPVDGGTGAVYVLLRRT